MGVTGDRFDVVALVTASNEFETSSIPVRLQRVGSLRDRLPPGRFGRALAYAAGDGYSDLESALQGSTSSTRPSSTRGSALRRRGSAKKLGFKLALTVWETIPAVNAYRWPRERRNRRRVVESADLLLPTTERARRALLLEGIEERRIEVCYPGIDTRRFAARSDESAPEHSISCSRRVAWCGRKAIRM